MAQPDEMMKILFINDTLLSLEEIENLMKLESPKDIKMRLAYEIVKIYHGSEIAKKAQENFTNTFQKGGLPENIEEIKTESGKSIMELLVEKKIVASKSDFRRLITENAVSNAVSGEKITDVNFKISENITLKVGKKRFVKIII